MNDNDLKVAVCQIMTRTSKKDTLNNTCSMIREACENGADIVVLPEMFTCPYSNDKFKQYAEDDKSETVVLLGKLAKDNGVYIIGGTVPELSDDKLYNTCYAFDRTGNIIAKYRKSHLFDINIEGKISFKESDTISAGNDICVFDTEYGKMGIAICFDIRFPELFRVMAEMGAQIIFVPAQFNMTTGPVHWELVTRARAIDNENYIVAASAARSDSGYQCWGHSEIIGPYGDIRSTCDEKEQIIYADINLSDINSVRHQIPIFDNIRNDIY